MKFSRETSVHFLVALRAMTLLLLAGGILLALYLVCYGALTMIGAYPERRLLFPAFVGFLFVLAVSLVCGRALLTFYHLCGRLKHQRAFSAANARAMHGLSRDCFLASALLAVCPIAMMAALRDGAMLLPYLELWVIAFVMGCIGLLFLAMDLLMQRAKLLQDDQDLTV